MCVCMYSGERGYVCVCTQVREAMYVCTYVRMYVCTYVRMCVYSGERLRTCTYVCAY